MIRIRRVPQKVPIGHLYEVEIEERGAPESKLRRVTRSPTSVLMPLLGVGDAWSFVDEANRQWALGNRGWAVEFEEKDPDEYEENGDDTTGS